MFILDQIYEQSSNAKRYENYILACCPFHNDRHPSLLVYEDWFRCLSCGAQGKPEKLLKSLSPYSFAPQPEKSAAKSPWFRWLKEYETINEICKTAHHTLKKFNKTAYLKSRGFNEATILQAKLGFLDGFYTIPIFSRSGKLTGALARAGENFQGSRYYLPKDQNPDLLYSPSWKKVDEADEVYVTFGLFDTLSIHQLGKAAISTTSGKRVSGHLFNDIRKKFFIFSDYGEEEEARKLASELGWRGVTVRFEYPPNCKDPNDALQLGVLQQVLA